jgi:hypothetical protein
LDFRTVPTVWYFLLDFGTVPTVWYFLLDFGTVPTVWYFLLDFGTVWTMWHFVLLDFETVPTVLYFVFFILLNCYNVLDLTFSSKAQLIMIILPQTIIFCFDSCWTFEKHNVGITQYYGKGK